MEVNRQEYPEHTIDTSKVYIELCLSERWKEFEADFIYMKFQFTLQLLLFKKGLPIHLVSNKVRPPKESFVKYYYKGQDRIVMSVSLPFSKDFILPRDKYEDYVEIMYHDTPCLLEKDEENYDLFFALLFYLTDLMKTKDFLAFHLSTTFNNDISTYKDYIELLFLKYDFFLKEKHEKITHKFFQEQEKNKAMALPSDSIHDINSSIIMDGLSYRWTEFDRTFIADTVKLSLAYLLIVKEKRSFSLTNEEFSASEYLKEYEYLCDKAKETDTFPIPRFFPFPENNDESITSIIGYSLSCTLDRKDPNYDLFFALQYYLTDFMESKDFLAYHLATTFSNDIETYADFFEQLLLKYDFFLAHKHEKLVHSFFDKFKRLEQATEKTKKNYEQEPKKNIQKDEENNQKNAEYILVIDKHEFSQGTGTEKKAQEIIATITEKLSEYQSAFNNDTDYQKAIQEISTYFLYKQATITNPIFVKNGNVKNIAFVMGEIWRSLYNNPINYEYLTLYKQLFSIFKDQKIDKNNLFSTNLYKYSITKT
jgi:hypothetical protein